MDLNIYINGVGGQGIGVLAAIIGESLIEEGYNVIGSDTHGLAQRHGSVSSHIRIGKDVYYPLIEKNSADIVLSLERLEALRAAEQYLKNNGILIFYDSIYQPILTRIGKNKYPEIKDIENICNEKKANFFKIKIENLKDYRKQNIAIIGKLISLNILKINEEIIINKIKEYLKYDLEENIKIYNESKKL